MRRRVFLALGALFWTVLAIAHRFDEAMTIGQAADDIAGHVDKQSPTPL